MGNRAVITTRKDLKDIGVYLHWNGGRDSVEGFLTYCKIKGYCPPEHDNYGWAYLCTIIGNYFNQSGLSLGVDVANKLDCDNWDNGTYIIKDWKIVDRLYQCRREQDKYSFMNMLLSLDKLYRNIELFWYIQIATFHMVIYNSDCLHIRIYNRAAYKLKASFF